MLLLDTRPPPHGWLRQVYDRLEMPPEPTPHSHTPRWLAVAAGVLALHGLALQGLWHAAGPPRPTDANDAEGTSGLVQGMVLPSVSTAVAVAPPPPTRRSAPPAAAPPPPDGALLAVAPPTPTPNPGLPEPAAAADATPELPPEATAVAAAEPPAPRPATGALPPAVNAQWQYEVSGSAKGLPYQASATMRWQVEQDHYKTQLSLGAFLVGSRSQTSEGRLGPSGLKPELFVDKARRERQLRFDWAARTVQSPEQPVARPLVAGAQDRLSVFMQLSSLLAGLPHGPEVDQVWRIPVAGFSGTEDWVFHYQGPEALDLPAGPFATWKLERPALHARDQKVELWFAPDFHHLPVRIRLSQADGDSVDQRLSSR